MNINDHEDNFQFKKKGKLSESSLIMAASGGDFILIKVESGQASNVTYPT